MDNIRTLDQWDDLCSSAISTTAKWCNAAIDGLRRKVEKGGRIDHDALEQAQYQAHGVAWLATLDVTLTQVHAWAKWGQENRCLQDIDRLVLAVVFGEYLAQIQNGIPISQSEIVRPHDLGLDNDLLLSNSAIQTLIKYGNTPQQRVAIATLMAKGQAPSMGDRNETHAMIRDQFHRFAQDKITPHAHEWHLKDDLIPMEIIEAMSQMGVFGVAIPEENGGLGMGKVAMCIVTEELSRAFLAVGSLSTRAEIAAELIRLGGTEEQKNKWLPAIASGQTLTTAVFTEPNTGSDLAHLTTRAVKEGKKYTINGAKTWITHGARSDLMTVLARTNSAEKGYKGLSMFLAEKPRGTIKNPFPAEGMDGSEIEVLGYRGMKEYEIAFNNFTLDTDCLLGSTEGQGFKQLMATFESARIQTAARAVGVAQSALESGLNYAKERVQFGKPIVEFPRIGTKIGMMAAETTAARQVTYFSARAKDSDERCDIEAGMSKLLAARIAWANADSALQIHGGNGYALEYPVSRIMCDARILNIFEGAAEIQAQVIARGLLSSR